MNPLPTKPDNVCLKCKYWSKSLTSKFHHNRRNTFLKVDINMLKNYALKSYCLQMQAQGEVNLKYK